MASTYTPIATQTLGSAAASVTFSSIPSTYTDLVFVWNGTNNAAEYIQARFNSDTGTNYSITNVTGDGSSAISNRKTSQNQVQLNWYSYPTTNVFEGSVIAFIQNYANTTTYKTVLSRANTASRATEAIVGLWRSTAAISTILLFPSGTATFNAGSTFTLYGIKAA